MPYAPGIEYRGDKYLFEGISGLGDSIGSAIKEYRTNQKASDAADSAYELMLHTLTPLAQSGALPDDFVKQIPEMGKFSSLSLSKKQSTLGQLTASAGMLINDAKRQEEAKNAESLRLYREQAERREDRLLDQQDRENNANAGFLSDLNTFKGLAPNVTGQMPSPLAPELASQLQQPGGPAIAALARNPGVSKDVRDLMLRNLLEADDSKVIDSRFEEDPVTGSRFYRLGKVPLPSGVNPEKAVRFESVEGPEGNRIGQIARSGKETKYIPDPKDPGQLPPSAIVSLNKTLADLQRTRQISNEQAKAGIDEQIATIKALMPKPKGAQEATAEPAKPKVQWMYDPKSKSLKPSTQ
jgi:hypothetical protein